MLARVQHFLLHERLYFCRQPGRRGVAETAHTVDEKPLALGKRDRQRVVEGCGEWVVVQPPAPHARRAAETAVARGDGEIGGSCFRHGNLRK